MLTALISYHPVTDIDRIKPVEETETEDGETESVSEPAPPPSVTEPITQLGPNLDRLWAYTCNLTKGRNVSCMSWNKINSVSIAYSRYLCAEHW